VSSEPTIRAVGLYESILEMLGDEYRLRSEMDDKHLLGPYIFTEG
jgi:hypothetical protein